MNPQPTPTQTLFQEQHDFSIVLGGPLYQLYRRAHLTGSALELLRRRVLAVCLFTWLPLLALSVLEGHAWGQTVQVPFIFDVQTHARFLVALPLFIIAEMLVHQRMRPVLRQFIERGLVPESAQSQFDAALAAAVRLRNSVVAEVLLLVFVYVVGVWVVWRTRTALQVTTWYSLPAEGRLRPTLAGWWLMFIALPLFQFILFRWYFRLWIWMRFLWQVARIDLRLMPTHPDQAGGLGFLANIVVAFAPLLFAQGALLSGWIAGRIFFENASLLLFKVQLVVVVVFLLLLVLGPLLIFAPHLGRAKRKGLREYGMLASRYTREFDRKWLRADDTPEPLLGTADVQSLSDLGNSFNLVRDMRMVPFGRDTTVRLIATIVVPVLPLTLTMIPLDQLIRELLKVIF